MEKKMSAGGDWNSNWAKTSQENMVKVCGMHTRFVMFECKCMYMCIVQLLEEHLETVKTENKTLEAQSNELVSENFMLQDENRDLTKESVKLKAVNDTLIAENTALRTENVALKNEHSQLKAKLVALNNDETVMHACCNHRPCALSKQLKFARFACVGFIYVPLSCYCDFF